VLSPVDWVLQNDLFYFSSGGKKRGGQENYASFKAQQIRENRKGGRDSLACNLGEKGGKKFSVQANGHSSEKAEFFLHLHNWESSWTVQQTVEQENWEWDADSLGKRKVITRK